VIVLVSVDCALETLTSHGFVTGQVLCEEEGEHRLASSSSGFV
jgi:hypothetical protein